MTDTYPQSDVTRLKRHPERGSYDRAVVHAILDEALVCHLAFVAGGHALAMPTTFARRGETIYVHGARANRALDVLVSGAPFSLTVTLIDGLVLARSAFHHSMNYRSVVITGAARVVEERAEKLEAMTLLVDRLASGRSRSVRGPADWELDVTRVIAVDIEHASAKTRSGGPLDGIEDMAQPCWAGVVPLRLVASAPIAEAGTGAEHEPPEVPRCFAP